MVVEFVWKGSIFIINLKYTIFQLLCYIIYKLEDLFMHNFFTHLKVKWTNVWPTYRNSRSHFRQPGKDSKFSKPHSYLAGIYITLCLLISSSNTMYIRRKKKHSPQLASFLALMKEFHNLSFCFFIKFFIENELRCWNCDLDAEAIS